MYKIDDGMDFRLKFKEIQEFYNFVHSIPVFTVIPVRLDLILESIVYFNITHIEKFRLCYLWIFIIYYQR